MTCSIRRSGFIWLGFIGVLALAPVVLNAQGNDPWTVSLSHVDPLPIGQCSAVNLVMRNPATNDRPRNAAGDYVTTADFEMTAHSPTGKAVAEKYWDKYHFEVCACQGAAVGSVATVTARYPGNATPPATRVNGVAFHRTVSFKIGPAIGASNPAECVKKAANPSPSPAPTTPTTPTPTTTTPTTTTPTTTTPPVTPVTTVAPIATATPVTAPPITTTTPVIVPTAPPPVATGTTIIPGPTQLASLILVFSHLEPRTLAFALPYQPYIYDITVKDGTGAPVSGVSVSGKDGVSGKDFSTPLTDSQGSTRYVMVPPPGVVPGTKTITFTATKAGFTSAPLTTATINYPTAEARTLSIASITPATSQTVMAGQSVTYVITVRDGAGKLAKEVQIVGNDGVMSKEFYTSLTDSTGVTKYTTTVPVGAPLGPKQLTFTAMRDGNLSSAVSTTTVQVSLLSTPTTTATPVAGPVQLVPKLVVTVASAAQNVIPGQSVSFIITVKDAAGSPVPGALIFWADDIVEGGSQSGGADGKYSFQTTVRPATSVGTKTISFYANKSGYPTSEMVTATVTVFQPKLIVTVEPATQTVWPGQSVSFTITVKDAAGSPVVGAWFGWSDDIVEGGASSGGENGKYSFQTTVRPATSVGTKTISFYANKSGYPFSEMAKATLQVVPDPDTTKLQLLIASAIPSTMDTVAAGESVTFVVAVKDGTGSGVFDGEMLVDFNGTRAVMPRLLGPGVDFRFTAATRAGMSGPYGIGFTAQKTGYHSSPTVVRAIYVRPAP